jgi:hypothetical protein
MGMPHRRMIRRHGHGDAMCSPRVLVHCLSRLGAAAAVFPVELLRGDGVLTKRAPECGTAIHRFDGVMSHSLNCRRLSRHDSELKLQPLLAGASI